MKQPVAKKKLVSMKESERWNSKTDLFKKRERQYRIEG